MPRYVASPSRIPFRITLQSFLNSTGAGLGRDAVLMTINVAKDDPPSNDIVSDRAAMISIGCAPVMSFFAFIWPPMADAASIVLALIAAALLLQKRTSWKSGPLLLAGCWLLFVLFSAGHAASLDLPGHPWRGLEKHMPIALGPVAAISLGFACERLRFKQENLVALFLLGLIAGGVAVLLRNNAISVFAHGWPEFSGDRLGRLNRNYAALTCGLSILAGLSLANFLYLRKKTRLLWRLCGLVVLAAVLLFEGLILAVLQSRTAYAAAAVGLAVWLAALAAMSRARRGTPVEGSGWAVPAIVFVVVAGIVAAYFPEISERLGSKGGSTEYIRFLIGLMSGHGIGVTPAVDERTQLAAAAVGFIGQRPWFGWGPDATQLLKQFSTAPNLQLLTQFHNGYIELLVSFGMVGAALAAILVLAIIAASVRQRAENFPTARLSPSLFAGALSLTAYVAVTNFTESIVFVKPVAVICIFFGALACARPQDRRSPYSG